MLVATKNILPIQQEGNHAMFWQPNRLLQASEFMDLREETTVTLLYLHDSSLCVCS